MMARVRQQLHYWKMDECEVIEWLMRDNEVLGCCPELLIERMDYSVEAHLVLLTPMALRVEA